ncbi:16S rRNA (guanine(527)-N(7))-methyltransferase RsmG [Sphingomonas aliaeris]|uniref:Ribosomal RNA small subunit methyltransferase G n=1 Tax=Sphingomonas aliaeris TaxID=2759526 RepID=A0A974NUJ8_9SPHN|nr:16S rRNA (guanine(527)-N(7))-methyltransferase RsmG [Sphingomonas aliaeris]QQV77162.1 16S rRNA (guanine(527)-N(7))-methyltransferase RsmG [Sphingomonas aliaeris]
MNEDEAKAWIADRYGACAVDRLAIFAGMVEQESERQNLISAATIPLIWSRHIVDSAQLLPLASSNFGAWADIGTGAGFPGLVVGAITENEVVLVEPRKRRVEFLQSAIDMLQLRNTTVEWTKAERVRMSAGVISARAVSQIDALLTSTHHLANRDTVWILPKGRNSHEEVAQANRSWHGMFHVEQSVTDPTSFIVIASGIARR